MRSIIIICIASALLYPLKAQSPLGTWTDHLSYNSAVSVVSGGKEIFASTGSSILVYNTEFNELRKLSKVNGLTETGISTLGYSEEYETLIVAYSSANIDLINKLTIRNIPDISRKYIAGLKEINRIRTRGRYAYLACSFGIVVIDILREEIRDTWKPANSATTNEVWDIAFLNNKIFAATSTGVFEADENNQGLAYFANWKRMDELPGPAGRCNAIIEKNGRLYINKSGVKSSTDTIFCSDNGFSIHLVIPGVKNKSIDHLSDGFAVSSGYSARLFDSSGNLLKTITGSGTINSDIRQVAEYQGILYYADFNSGLLMTDPQGSLKLLSVPGPMSNNAADITISDGKTIICGGSVSSSWNNRLRPYHVSVFEDNKWENLGQQPVYDPLRSAIDPADKNHFFVSSWGGGILEYTNGIEFKDRYYDANSPLQTIIPGAQYVRVCGMAFDKDGNLWITQTEVPGSIKVYRPDESWIVIPVTIDAPTIGDIIITEKNHKWIVLPRGYGVFVLDDNNTPADFSDDRYKKMLITDSDNKVYSMVNCISEDHDGNIWIGTDQGPLVYYNPSRIFDEDIKAFRIKVPRDDGTGLADYMLGTENITCIEIDGANRKWMGTSASGAWLLSPDGVTRLKNFNESNSPMFSNSIVSIAIDHASSEVWFSTTKGTLSIRGDATEAKPGFEDSYVFPNPVREDYEGIVTVTGLMNESRLRITDISGNLVFSTVSEGGMATWDLRTYNGMRVRTGVYLIFCSSAEGSAAHVIKLLVISRNP